MADRSQSTVCTAGWHGRSSGDPMTIFCSQNGWREAVWKRDKRGAWQEVSATMRRVVAIDWIGNVTLGDARKIK